MKNDASSGKEEPNFASARQQMGTLYQSIMLSPDLTDAQKSNLSDSYFKQMHELHENAKRFGLQAGAGSADEGEADLDAIRMKALEIMNSGR